ncbi:MAG: hypothetical protein A3F68_01450 [Acidobacteria bacterium RIFCSPLOWO2_12_FULL_54_10]|nr:MAG: hypothetical protein A3F68_01450 [Acidobacteria bacterium RIFCSPLOWO2_12_FULL_54_10]
MTKYRLQHRIGALGIILILLSSGCAKRIRFDSLPQAQGGKATARVELTYDRNNTLEIKLENVPDPATLNPQYTRYVLWVATPDRQHTVNIGQLRVDEKRNAAIKTLTPLRDFILFITAEPQGDAITPSPDVIFQTAEIRW